MTQLELLERILERLDEAANLIEQLPEGDELRNRLPELEGNSNGGWFYTESIPADYWFLRDEVIQRVMAARGSSTPTTPAS